MTYAEILSSIMEKRPEVVALTAESRKALGTIPEVFSDRFYDVGIAEMTGVGCAAGLSATGKIPFFPRGLLCLDQYACIRVCPHNRGNARV